MENTIASWVKFLILLSINIAAFVGNLLMLTVGLRNKSLRVYQNAFIFNVALADMLESILIIPIVLANIVASQQVLPHDWCRVFAALKVTITLTSVYSLAGISLQRYYYVVKRKQEMNNARRAIIAIVLVWCVSALFSITPFFGWGRVGFDQHKIVCTALFYQTASHTIVVFASALFLNLAVMIFCYVSIFITFRRQNNMIKIQTGLPILSRLPPVASRKISWIDQLIAAKRKFSSAPKTTATFKNNLEVKETYPSYINSENSTEKCCYVIQESPNINNNNEINSSFEEEDDNINNMKSPKTSTTELTPKHRTSSTGSGINERLTSKELQLLKTIVVVISTFFACWTPYVIYNILRVFEICEGDVIIDCITMWLGFSNSAINPILYGLLNGQFRGAMLDVIAIFSLRKQNQS